MSFYHLRDHEVTKTARNLDPLTPVLVAFDTNWADEMDIEGFRVMTVAEWINLYNAFDIDQAHEIYFGTNESNTYSEAREVLDEFSVYELTPEQASVMNTIFPYGHGEFPEEPYVEEEDEMDDAPDFEDLTPARDFS